MYQLNTIMNTSSDHTKTYRAFYMNQEPYLVSCSTQTLPIAIRRPPQECHSVPVPWSLTRRTKATQTPFKHKSLNIKMGKLSLDRSSNYRKRAYRGSNDVMVDRSTTTLRRTSKMAVDQEVPSLQAANTDHTSPETSLEDLLSIDTLSLTGKLSVDPVILCSIGTNTYQNIPMHRSGRGSQSGSGRATQMYRGPYSALATGDDEHLMISVGVQTEKCNMCCIL